MKDLGAAKKILGMRITRDRKNHKLRLSQGEYTKKVLERFRMQNAKPVSTPLASHFKLTKEMCPKTQEEIEYMSRVPYSSAVGSLMYAMVCTRPDIAHAEGVVSRYMNNPGKEHWEAVKWILRYLRGTTTHALCFGGSDTFLQGYVDSDMAGDKDSRRSTTGYVFTIGGTTVSWISKLQKVVALSTIEVEYVAAIEASKEMIWLQRFMEELGKKQENSQLYCDSQSAIHLAKNSAFHLKTKHIQLRYHFIRSTLEDGQLKLEKIHTSQNPTDMLTKGVTREKLSSYSVSVGLQEWRWKWEIFQVQEGSESIIYNNGGVVEISLQVGDCWLWSLIIFLIQRSLLSAVFIPHEVFTPQKYVHSSMRGSAEGGYPLCGVQGLSPRLGGLGASGPPTGVRGQKPPKQKLPCKSIL
jgi:hypothetical protein